MGGCAITGSSGSLLLALAVEAVPALAFALAVVAASTSAWVLAAATLAKGEEGGVLAMDGIAARRAWAR